MWRARIQLTASDLGIEQTDDVVQALSFGCHRLAPAKSFEQINICVRLWQKAIEEHSLNFPLLNGVRYVPDNQVAQLQAKLERQEREFSACVREFIEEYGDIQDEMIPVLKSALHSACKNEEAADVAIERVVNEYPSSQRIASKFGLEWNFFTISLPTSQDAVKTAKSAVPQVQKVIESMVTELRTELAEKVEILLKLSAKAKAGQSRAKNGFGQKSVESALAVLDKVERLNILNDPAITQQTNILRSLLDSEADAFQISQELDSVKTSLKKDITDAAQDAEKRLTGMGNRKLTT